MIEIKDLHLTLRAQSGDIDILRGIDLHIAQGEIAGLVGPSGSGKSSLLMVLAGLERATKGYIKMAGHDYATMDENARALFRRQHIGIIFQSFHLIPTMTAAENTALPLELAGAGDALAHARDILSDVGLGARCDHYPRQLSGGEQQRVAIARALIGKPAILLADEPTGNLDQTTGAQIIKLILDMAKARGTSLLLITHDNALAQKCDRVLTMRDGKMS